MTVENSARARARVQFRMQFRALGYTISGENNKASRAFDSR